MTIRRQMIVLIALPTLIIYFVVVGFTAVYMYKQSREGVERDMTRLAANYAARVDGHLAEVARIAETTTRAMESVPTITDEEVYDLLARNVSQTQLVYGSCMAFEPGSRKATDVLFAPYVCRSADGLRRMDINKDVYDWYRDPRFTWYSQPKALGRGVWSDPYFDEGAGNILMSTYSAPFRLNGAFGGVNTVDIDLPRLRETVGRSFDADLDFVILASDGRFVFDPQSDRIMSKTIFDFAQDTGNAALASLGREMLVGVPGAGVVEGWDRPERQLVFYAPILSTGWVFACRVPESMVMADVRRRALWSAGALALTLGLIIGCIGLVSRRIAGPISAMRDKVMEVAGGNLSARVDETAHSEEIRHLARSFNQMTGDLRAHIDRLAAETSARLRIEHDLKIARDIQRSLLPMNRPDLSGYEVVGWSEPADQTGGDYYDWQTLADGRTIITLADVSGHGIGPALVTAVCRAYARATAPGMQNIAGFLERMNSLIVNDVSSNGRFVTMAVAVVSPDGVVELLSAGHGPTFLVRAATGEVERFGGDGLPLGVLDGEQYDAMPPRLRLARGDSLVLLTDGFMERASDKGDMFGIDRLSRIIAEHAAMSAAELIAAIERAVKEFAGSAPQGDDMTAVVLRRT